MPTPWTRRILLANLVAQVGIVLTGGLVRLTESGLGCSTWPECEPGTYTPTLQPETGLHAYVEFGNRLLTFAVGVLAIAALVAVWRLRPRRRGLRLLAATPLLGVVAQVLLGGVTVLTDLHPVPVAGHFLLSMVLVAASTVLLLRLSEGDGPPRALVHPVIRRMAAGLAAVTAGVLVLGTAVTGAGPHSGDADSPARLGLDPRTVSWLHADLVLLLLGLTVGLVVALRVTGAPARAVRLAQLVLGVILVQGAVGYAQYALDLARPLVWAHMLGACLLVAAVTALQLGLRERAGVLPPAPRSPATPEVARV